MKKQLWLLLAIPALLAACQTTSANTSSESKEESISESESVEPIESSSKEKEIVPMQLSTEAGLVVKFSKQGARIESVELEGKHIAEKGFIAGRVANRIAGASFTLNGQTYNTNRNEGQNTLHGGSKGFGEVNWTLVEQTANSIEFSLHSADKDMGFPGNLDVTCKYTLDEDGSLKYAIDAKSDADTLFNPTNHLYMNMNGNQSNKNHNLWIDADKYTEVNSSLIPTGELKSVSGTDHDYTTKNEFHGNNDHNLCLNGEGYRKVAEMDGTATNYRVEVFTDRVGMQLYSDGKFICMECQDYPDAIHHENFPSIVLKANEEYHTETCYKFSKIA